MKKFSEVIYRLISYFKEKNIESLTSEYNPVLEINLVNGHYVLDAKNANYSFGGLHTAFRKIFKELKIGSKEFGRILILGFGAGSVASLLTQEFKRECNITGVEIDETVIKLAKKYFDIEKIKDLVLVNQDAFDFMKTNKEKYDMIVIDIYLDHIVPAKFETKEFLGFVKDGLSSNGMILFNKLGYDKRAKESAFRLKDLFDDVIGSTRMYSVPGIMPNYMLVYQYQDLKNITSHE